MLAVADSGYNETHLAEAGFAATAVIAPFGRGGPGLARGAGRHAPWRTEPLPTTWLSIGRVSPNKSLEHAITALAVTRLHRDPDATLRIIGKPATQTYDRALRRYVADLGLASAVRFEGHAGDAAVA